MQDLWIDVVAVATVLTALAAGKHRLSYNWTIGIQIMATVLYWTALFG